MTVVVGVCYEGGAVIAADSVATIIGHGGQRERLDKKTIQLAENLALGTCGSPRVKQLIEYGLEHIDAPGIGDDEHRWAVKSFVPALQAALDAGGSLSISVRDDIWSLGSSELLLAVRDRLFTVGSDFQIAEEKPCWATTGSGWEPAAGYLAERLGYDVGCVSTVAEATKHASAAVVHSQKQNAYCGGKVVTVNSTRLTKDEVVLVRKLHKELPKRP